MRQPDWCLLPTALIERHRIRAAIKATTKGVRYHRGGRVVDPRAAPPIPSSRITRRRLVPVVFAHTLTADARACLAALVRASATTYRPAKDQTTASYRVGWPVWAETHSRALRCRHAASTLSTRRTGSSMPRVRALSAVVTPITFSSQHHRAHICWLQSGLRPVRSQRANKAGPVVTRRSGWRAGRSFSAKGNRASG